MTDKTFTFTIEQIKDIYRAGIRRGSDEQSAYDWGCSPSGKEFDECVCVIEDIVNKGIKLGEEGALYTSWDTIESWFKENK